MVKGTSQKSAHRLFREYLSSCQLSIYQPVTYAGPDGKQYVAILSGVGGWAGTIVAAGSVSVIDVRTHKVIHNIKLPRGRVKPMGVVVTSDGKKVYTDNGLSNSVAVIDTSSNQVVKTIRVGEGPWGVVIGPAR